MHVYSSTADWGIIKEARIFTGNLFGIIFPYYPLSSWCVKHLGAKLFLKNLDFFIKLNSKAILRVLIDFVRVIS